jgi:hypothetical protein
LGKEHTITADNPSFKKPPAHFDSVVARGQTEPGRKFCLFFLQNNLIFLLNRSKR